MRRGRGGLRTGNVRLRVMSMGSLGWWLKGKGGARSERHRSKIGRKPAETNPHRQGRYLLLPRRRYRSTFVVLLQQLRSLPQTIRAPR